MPTRVWKDRVKFVTPTTGTGALAVPVTALPGFQVFASGDTGGEFTYYIEDGTAWEVSKGIYTHVNLTLNRTLLFSSTGSLLNLSGSAVVGVDWIAQSANAFGVSARTYIAGCFVTKGIGNTIDIGPGGFFDPSTNTILQFNGSNTIAPGSLTIANPQWNQVYMYDGGGGTPNWEIINNASPPATTYSGMARQGGTNGDRRWIGSFMSNNNGSGNIVAVDVKELAPSLLEIVYLVAPGTAPFRVLSAGSSTATPFASVALGGAIPANVCKQCLYKTVATLTGVATDSVLLNLALESTANSMVMDSVGYIGAPSTYSGNGGWFPLDGGVAPRIFYKTGAGTTGTLPKAYIDIFGYRSIR